MQAVTATDCTAAEVTPAYGMRPVGGFGIRGWRVHCPHCGHLSKLHTGKRGADQACRAHRFQVSGA